MDIVVAIMITFLVGILPIYGKCKLKEYIRNTQKTTQNQRKPL